MFVKKICFKCISTDRAHGSTMVFVVQTGAGVAENT
jgi:hypothetical protein